MEGRAARILSSAAGCRRLARSCERVSKERAAPRTLSSAQPTVCAGRKLRERATQGAYMEHPELLPWCNRRLPMTKLSMLILAMFLLLSAGLAPLAGWPVAPSTTAEAPSAAAASANPRQLTAVGHIGGIWQGIAVQGSYAYAGVGAEL